MNLYYFPIEYSNKTVSEIFTEVYMLVYVLTNVCTNCTIFLFTGLRYE